MTKLLATDGEGERLDRFELIAELAAGGMATVYLARSTGIAGFQRLVAIKRLHPHLAREPEFIEMFLDEARLAARIHHPNVVPIQEVGESPLGYYLVMDYVEGDTLARLLARSAQNRQEIPFGVTVRMLLDTLAGLHAAHEMTDDQGKDLQIVHRDVSPQNILVGIDGIARITDFGVARAASRLSTTRSGQLKGKLAYMAPEQARGGDVDRRADLFSCGIVLWEALALKRLFKGDGEAATLNRVLYDPIPPPTSARADVPKALEDVCMKALARDLDERYATAEAFADDLEKAARAVSTIGSVRDVASCLEQVVGSDLSQQREAVRAWLARSEPSTPSRPRGASVPPPSLRSSPRPIDSTKTRIEGGSRSEPSRPSTDAVTGPEKVSSVSSAVLQVATGTGSSDAQAALSHARSRGKWVAAIAVVAVIAAIAGFGASRLAPPETPPAPVAATEPTATATTTTAAPETPPSAPAPSAIVADDPPAALAGSAAVKPARPTTTTKPTRSGATSKPTASPPDDLSRNPYR